MMTSSFLARAGGPWQHYRGQSEKRATSTAPIAETARASVAAVEAGRPTHRRARRAAIFQGQVLNPSLLLLFLKGTPQRFLLTAVRTARVVSASRFLGHRAPGRSHHRHCCACCFLDAQAARVMEALESLATLRRCDPTTDTTSRHLVSRPHLLAAVRGKAICANPGYCLGSAQVAAQQHSVLGQSLAHLWLGGCVARPRQSLLMR